ncbi:MAG TPA: histidine phosphatase family protein, partial [Rubrivivax sp.]|nr:histidine phosphatase family protein [Rubrivivax sp.]
VCSHANSNKDHKRQPLVIYSSDLRRAQDTAMELAAHTGQQVHLDPRLRETDLGDWQGMTHHEVDAEAPGARLAWRDDAHTARLRAALVAPDDQQRLRVYNDHLATLTQALPDTSTSLARLMSPLFALAAERSAAGGDPVAENRCALLVLAFFANHRPLGSLLPAAYDWPRPQPLVVTLRERQDFALHFTISALLAAEAGTPLADVVGLWKEVNDARHGGSGFSFNDLAADRAGTRLGEMAVQEPLRLQRRIAAGVVDSDLLPRVDDLPEHLREADFVARYGGVGGAGYNRLLAQIEARLDALPLLR